ncbi:MAG: transcription-repair coupling factor [Planctomycetes bacterium]|nr:transcription-repair coupling factor [Planctomycetota bacterium]
MPTLPSLLARVGGLPAVAALAGALAEGRAAPVRGLHGSSAALLLAVVAPAGRTVLVVGSDPEEAAALEEDLALFSGDPAAVASFPAFGSRDPVHRSREERVLGARLSALEALATREGAPRFLVAPAAALLDGVPPPARVAACFRRVAPGDRVAPEEIARALDAARFARVARAEGPGEWALRGGVMDVFPLGRGGPVRVEWYGDEIASVRRFDPASQRSFGEEPGGRVLDLLPRADLVEGGGATLLDHLPAGSATALRDRDRIEEWVRRVAGHSPGTAAAWERVAAALPGRAVLDLSSLPPRERGEVEEPLRTAPVLDTARDPGRLGEVLARVAGREGGILVLAGNAAEAHRFRTLLEGLDPPPAPAGGIDVAEGMLSRPFRLPGLGVAVLSADALFDRHRLRRPLPAVRREGAASAAPVDVADLRPGDAVVHVVHGIAIYRGLEREERPGGVRESLVLEFRDDVRVSVPASRADLVHRYVGTRETAPRLSRYGSPGWRRRTEEVAGAVEDVAAELLEVQALRRMRPGIAHPPDGAEQAEFEASFPFADTPDQEEATRAVKADLVAPRPMDRLLCGDVGFGKTEVAIRAAFKCVLGGRQAAVLVPTTLLAEQHLETFTERFAGWPVTVECLSRFRSKAEQRAIVERTRQGGVDVLVGTHRLLQPDVEFRDLGLVVVDEEQRFGVEHKQRLRSLRATVDVLTMTATPIPRTLHMAMLGLRDASNLETPPEGRQAIETEVRAWGAGWVREAVLRELDRGGQVYFVHDRVASLASAAALLQEAVPEARIAAVHGQMHEDDIEDAMLRFARGAVDVLAATSIVENGLDFPNANTMIIDRAHRFGLADLHQLRGRVGRGAHRAWCYLVLPEGPVATDAERRVRAIEEYAGLGEGYRVALRDLEIRGAGNLLGHQQSGHIATVGYEMYCRLLEAAVRRLRGLPPPELRECTVDLPGPASLPPSYVADVRERIGVYRRFARAASAAEVEAATADLRDRFGAPPAEAAALADLARARVAAAAAGADLCWQPEPDRVALRASDPPALARALAGLGPRVRRVDERTFHLLLPGDLPPTGIPGWLARVLGAPAAPGAPPAAPRPRPNSFGRGGGRR